MYIVPKIYYIEEIPRYVKYMHESRLTRRVCEVLKRLFSTKALLT